MSDKFINALKKIEEDFTAEGYDVVLRRKGNDDLPVDVLTILHDDLCESNDEVLGEHFFLDGNDDDEARMFCSVLTITNELPQLNLLDLYVAITKINYYLPCGTFAVDLAGKSLCYKCVAPILNTLGEDDIYQQASINIMVALQSFEIYADYLVRLASDETDLQEMYGLLGVKMPE